MGITRTEGFQPKITATAALFKALGHPGRLAIIEHLINSPSSICNDIVVQIPLAQPTISRHLSELKNVGLIQVTIMGNNICYCINENKWEELKTAIEAFKMPQTNQNCK